MHLSLLFALLIGTALSAQTLPEPASNTYNSAKKHTPSDNAVTQNSEVDSLEDDFADNGTFDDDEFSDEFSDEPKEEVFDPLSGYNRVMTGFNNTLFDYFLDPVLIKGYNFILPEPARDSVHNFFENLYYPVSIVNNLFQLKFKNSGTETARFCINSTIGILGLFDPAKSWFDLDIHQEDFGQTLGYYGVGSGFHIVLPFFGPSNLRDFSGDFLDFYVNPIYYVDARKYNLVNNSYVGWAAITYKEFNEISLHAKEYKEFRKDALDLYPFLRDLYEQDRNRLIRE